ncbi:MAG: hypothetical protein UR26_C0001G0027 [candidate division TM6 bacterium GW2011_GWF2_32_72]|nr:MAG: hypothetical protein UR26_C0001G0027 [candidate division TM6 bacterium GW2011_GWF2_32_72]
MSCFKVKKVCFFILFSNQFFANITDPMQFKGLGNIFKESFFEYTPIQGGVYSYNDYFKNIYKYGDPESNLTKLVYEMFYILGNEEDLKETHHPLKPATYFTPEFIGEFLAAIKNYQNKVEEKMWASDSKLGVLKKDLKKIFFRQIKQSSTIALQLIEDRIDALKVKKGVDIQSEMKTLENAKKSIEDGKIENTFLGRDTDKIIKLILDVFKDQESECLPKYSLQYMFLTFLWHKVQDKKSILLYLNSFHKTLIPNELKQELFSDNWLNFYEDGVLQQQWIDEKYNEEQIRDFRRKRDFNFFEKQSLSSIEMDLAQGVYEKRFKSDYPSEILYLYQVKYRDQTFSDCGETSLRNFLNLIFYLPETKSFNLELVKKVASKNEYGKRLIAFYEEHPDISDFDKIHNEWAEVVSGIPGQEYKRSIGCEIPAYNAQRAFYNMNSVIKSLTGSDGIIQFLAKVASFGVPISYELDKSELNLDNAFANIKIKLKIRETAFTWVFKQWHFKIDFPKSSINSVFNLNSDELKKYPWPERSYLINQVNDLDNLTKCEVLQAIFVGDFSISHAIVVLSRSTGFEEIIKYLYKKAGEKADIKKDLIEDLVNYNIALDYLKDDCINYLDNLPLDQKWLFANFFLEINPGKSYFEDWFANFLERFDLEHNLEAAENQDFIKQQFPAFLKALVLSKLTNGSLVDVALKKLNNLKNNREFKNLYLNPLKEILINQGINSGPFYDWIMSNSKDLE